MLPLLVNQFALMIPDAGPSVKPAAGFVTVL